MTKVKVWLDSGANAFSCREQEFELEDTGISIEEWKQMTHDEKEEFMKDIAWDRMEWGYCVDGEDN